MKKILFIITSFLIISIIVSCKKENNATEPKTFLTEITESIYLPNDSVTTQYQLDRNGMIVLEKSSKYGIKKGYKDGDALKDIESNLKYCKIFTYGASDQLVKITVIDNGSRILSFSSDSLIYQNNQVVRRELKNFVLPTPLGTFTFTFPFWLTKHYFENDASGKIIAETDSIFICHDYPKNSVDFQKISPKFAYKVLIKNEYNKKDELIKKTTESFKTIPSFYSNGNAVIDVTPAGKLVSGTTIYNYEYNSQNQLISKFDKFMDSRTNQVYNSIFSYTYGNN